MKSPGAYKPLKGSTHSIPKAHKLLKATSPREMITVTLIVRRRKGGPKLRGLKDFAAKASAVHGPVNRAQFIANHGAEPKERLAQLMQVREPLYREIADHCILTDQRRVNWVAERAVQAP